MHDNAVDIRTMPVGDSIEQCEIWGGMMEISVLISIRPMWCKLIASGEKTIEVRKTRPKKTPFKAYIYCTKGGPALFCRPSQRIGNGKVIGEFVCDRITEIQLTDEGYDFDVPKMTSLKYEEMEDYLGGKNGYGWHISELKIYDEPKELSDFRLYNTSVVIEDGFPMPTHEIRRPPQSWMYVEEK